VLAETEVGVGTGGQHHGAGPTEPATGRPGGDREEPGPQQLTRPNGHLVRPAGHGRAQRVVGDLVHVDEDDAAGMPRLEPASEAPPGRELGDRRVAAGMDGPTGQQDQPGGRDAIVAEPGRQQVRECVGVQLEAGDGRGRTRCQVVEQRGEVGMATRHGQVGGQLRAADEGPVAGCVARGVGRLPVELVERVVEHGRRTEQAGRGVEQPVPGGHARRGARNLRHGVELDGDRRGG
jgi:hypothetical protein